jgi:PAS domain S-box-containing protein
MDSYSFHRQGATSNNGRQAHSSPILLIWACVLLASVPMLPLGAYGDGNGAALRFLGNRSLPPMIYDVNGKPVGVVVDLAEAIAKRMKSPVHLEYMNWATAQELVLDGKADALLQINPTEERSEAYDFSGPLLDSEFSIFVRAGREGIFDLNTLNGTKVGVEEKGLPIGILKQYASIHLTVIPDVIQGMRLLANGSIDAVVVDRWVGSFVLAENHINGIRIAGEAFERSSSAIAVKKGNTKLLAEINGALASIKADGTYAKILSKWRPKEVIFQTRDQYLRQKGFLIAVLCMFVLAVVWSTFLWREIAKRKKAEKSVQESESRFRSLFESSPGAVILTTCDEGTLAANPAACAMTGYSEREICKMGQLGILDVKDPRLSEAMAERDRSGRIQGWELTALRRNGEKFPVEVDSIVLPGESTRSFVIMRDITDRKRTEEALRESEERYRGLVEQAVDGIFLADAQGRYVDANSAGAHMLGYTLEEIRNLKVTDVISSEDIARMPDQMSNLSKGAVVINEWQFRRKDGSTFPGEVVGRQLSDGRLLGILRDITDRKRVEELLRESEERLRLALASANFGTFDFNPLTADLGWDDRTRQIWGFQPGEHVDFSDALQRIHAEDQEAVTNALNAALAPDASADYEVEYRIVWPDTSIHWSNDKGRVYFQGHGEKRKAVRIVGIQRDMPAIKVIGLSMHEEGELSSAMRQAGAVAYVTKGGAPESLVEAIRNAMHSETSLLEKEGSDS